MNAMSATSSPPHGNHLEVCHLAWLFRSLSQESLSMRALGSKRTMRQISSISKKSTDRSPDSIFATNDCGRPKALATSC